MLLAPYLGVYALLEKEMKNGLGPKEEGRPWRLERHG